MVAEDLPLFKAILSDIFQGSAVSSENSSSLSNTSLANATAKGPQAGKPLQGSKRANQPSTAPAPVIKHVRSMKKALGEETAEQEAARLAKAAQTIESAIEAELKDRKMEVSTLSMHLHSPLIMALVHQQQH